MSFRAPSRRCRLSCGVSTMSDIHAPSAPATLLRSRDSKKTRELDIALPAMDALSEELNRLAAINAELVGRLRGAAAAVADESQENDGDLEALRQENIELRARVEELEAQLASQNEDAWAERQ